MLETIFLVCAVIGGTVMVCQFAMTLLGMGDDGGDFDVDAGDVDFDAGGDVELDAGGDVDADHGLAHHDTSWLFGVISFRTVVAFLAFFGLGGYGAASAGQSQIVSVVIALACGGAAMYSVYFLMRTIYRLQADGTRKIKNALGARGAVLVPLPPHQSGVGKIHVSMQGRLVELSAMTESSEKLGTGKGVEVVEILGPSTVLVAPVVEHDAQVGDATPDSETHATARSES